MSLLPSSPSSLFSLSVEQLRTKLASQSPKLDANDDTWWLLGTSGCHLCDQAETLISQLQVVIPVKYQLLDIINFEDELMSLLATKIPIIITPTSQLNYPFSILDLQRLSEVEKERK